MPSRRESIELTEDERRKFLDSSKTITIVSNGRDGYPHTMPMWFYRSQDDCIYCTTFRKAQKVLNYKRDSKATLLVETGTEYAELKSVMIYATAEVIDDLEAVQDTLLNINTRGQEVDPAQRETLIEAMSGTAPKRVVIKFTPEKYVSWDHSKLGGVY
jgi:nitroimidazol reductase NimA-like FMN-containing flavoprotein (pyridoxamine 5'-phosphate oxidase superfamily)